MNRAAANLEHRQGGGQPQEGAPCHLKGVRSKGRHQYQERFLFTFFGTTFDECFVDLSGVIRRPRCTMAPILRPSEGAVAEKYFFHRGRPPG